MARIKGLTRREVKYLIVLILGAFGFFIVEGDSRIIDGDTIKVGTERVRLQGIDAPEMSQTCKCAGKKTFCGKDAARALKKFVANDEIFCDARERDSYGRLVGECFVRRNGKKISLNRWMVENGHAVAYTHYSRKFAAAERNAEKEKKGIWACAFEMPWDYRRKQRSKKRH